MVISQTVSPKTIKRSSVSSNCRYVLVYIVSDFFTLSPTNKRVTSFLDVRNYFILEALTVKVTLSEARGQYQEKAVHTSNEGPIQ